jgi:hypothetical protein
VPRKPTDREQYLMTRLGFKTVEALEEALDRPEDPSLDFKTSPVYPVTEEDLEPDLGPENELSQSNLIFFPRRPR